MTTQYASALEFLFGRIDYERTPTIPYQEKHLKLQRMERLLQLVGDPQSVLRVIHVAGTKGKGSTATMINAILVAAGYRAGLYSSPHLSRLEERIRINGEPCTPEQLVLLVDGVAPAVLRLDTEFDEGKSDIGKPTYFEIMTAMSMLHFRQQNVDYAILEVGLGGRLDSTNVCDPSVTVITSISFDHKKQLGNTLDSIATEKAGILKPGIPLVSGVRSGEARRAIERVADAQEAPLFRATLGTDFDIRYAAKEEMVGDVRQTAKVASSLRAKPDRAKLGQFDYLPSHETLGDPITDISLGMLGKHQATNASIAITVVRLLVRDDEIKVSTMAIRAGLLSAQCPARIEQMGTQPPVVLDAAHNGASIEALLSVLEESFAGFERIVLFGTTSGKNIDDMLDLLVPACDCLVLTQYQENPRSYPAEKLHKMVLERLPSSECPSNLGARRIGNRIPRVIVEPDARQAWLRSRVEAGSEKLICVTGSFFLAAELRPMIQDELGCFRRAFRQSTQESGG